MSFNSASRKAFVKAGHRSMRMKVNTNVIQSEDCAPDSALGKSARPSETKTR